MAETIALALEGRFEDYTVGKDITLERVQEITAIAEKHGFRMSGFRSFEREVTEEQIEAVRRNARKGIRRAYKVPHKYWKIRTMLLTSNFNKFEKFSTSGRRLIWVTLAFW
jgi:hypothetical protein